MINLLPLYMLRALLLTILIETAAAMILGVRKKEDVITVILAQIVTNPIVVSVSSAVNIFYGIEMRHISLAVLEILAVAAEALIYKKCLTYKKISALPLSLILNGISCLLGLIINKFI